MTEYFVVLFLFFLGCSGAKEMLMREGDSQTLNSDVTKEQHDMMLWYFNDTCIALINGGPSTSCLYDGEGGRFGDRLEVDYESGSLTITNITTEHTGQYEAWIIRSESTGKTESLKSTKQCNRIKVIKINRNLGELIKSVQLTVSASQSETNEESMEEQDTNKGSVLPIFLAVGLLCVLIVTAIVLIKIRGAIYSPINKPQPQGERN